MTRRLRYAGLLAMGMWCLSPFLWEVLTSLKPTAYLTRLPPVLPPWITFEHYRAVLLDRDFIRMLLNSAGIATLVALSSLTLGASSGFALALLNSPGKTATLALALAISMFPCVSVIGPLYLGVRLLHLRDTWLALILTHTVFTLPLTLWTLRSSFQALPPELFKAGLVDGLTPFEIFAKIYLPLASGGLATCAILNFIFSWNEFLFALTFTTTSASRTLPVGIALFAGIHEIPFGELAAAAVFVSIPVILLAMVFQKGIVSGLTIGAVKG